MFNWFLRLVTVAAASWLSYVYILMMSGGSLSPASLQTLRHSLLALWVEARQGMDRFDWLILSPLAIGFVLVAFLAYGLLRPAGR